MNRLFLDINTCLNQYFEPIGLKDLERVELMDRQDTKYFFRADLLPEILRKIGQYYNVLEIENRRCFQYDSLYYDTPNFKLYHQHHNRRLNRYKIRYRKYVESDLTFFEVKLKSNKGRTIKERVKCNDIQPQLSQHVFDFLQKKIGADAGELQPQMQISYKRITLADKGFKERVTIDLDMNFARGDAHYPFGELAIVEIKQGKFDRQSPFITALHELHILPGSLSKYCFAVAQHCEGVKTNRFKKLMRRVEKINAQ